MGGTVSVERVSVESMPVVSKLAIGIHIVVWKDHVH